MTRTNILTLHAAVAHSRFLCAPHTHSGKRVDRKCCGCVWDYDAGMFSALRDALTINNSSCRRVVMIVTLPLTAAPQHKDTHDSTRHTTVTSTDWSRFNEWSPCNMIWACAAFVLLCVVLPFITAVIEGQYAVVQWNEAGLPYSTRSGQIEERVLSNGRYW